jgi:xylose isomerase
MSEFLPNIRPIKYEGPKSKNPLAFKHYNPGEIVEGKTMAAHLRFSIVYWHTMCGQGADMFGGPTAIRPWDAGLSGLDLGKARVPVFSVIDRRPIADSPGPSRR